MGKWGDWGKLLKVLAVVSAMVVATACSSGGDGKKSNPPASGSSQSSASSSLSGPQADDFSFEALEDQALSTQVESETVEISGFEDTLPISIEAEASVNAEYKIDEGEYTDTASTIEAGQSVTLRVTTADAFSESVTATLQIADKTADFVVTTLVRDVTPEPFSFTLPRQTFLPGNKATSEAVVISGLNAPAPVSIDGDADANAVYKIEDGPWTDADGQIEDGQSIQIRMDTPDFGQTLEATLTIGGVPATLSVTSVDRDNTPSDFSLSAQTPNPVALNAQVLTNSYTVAGVNDSINVSVSNGEYRIDEEDWASEDTTISEGQTITLRITASSSFSTNVNASLTLGSETQNITVTTLDRDNTPDDFTFTGTPSGLVLPGTTVTSNTVTISGLNDIVNVTVDNGEYKIDDGNWVAFADTISNGQTITLRLIASDQFDAPKNATLSVGSVSKTLSTTTEPRDNTPTDFTLQPTPANLVLPEAEVNFAAITVDDVNDDVLFKLSAGEYQINGGAWTAANTTDGDAITVAQDDQITIRATAPAEYEATLDIAVTIGDTTKNYSIETQVRDAQPDPIAFEQQSDVDYETVLNSNTVTVSGINTSLGVRIEGGEYQINNGQSDASAWFAESSENQTINNNQTLTLRCTSGDKGNQETTATLYLIDEENSAETGYVFSVTTQADSEKPTVNILFPPPVSMSEGSDVYVRGTATDVRGQFDVQGEEGARTITLKLNGVDTEATVYQENENLDEIEWALTAPLTNGMENTITVSVSDEAANASDNQSVMVKQDVITNAFPDNVNPFVEPYLIDIYQTDSELSAFISDLSVGNVIRVDLLSGERTIFTNGEVTNFYGVHIGSDDSLYVSDPGVSEVFKYDLEQVAPVQSFSQNLINGPFEMEFVENENAVFVTSDGGVVKIDSDGEQSWFSNAGENIPNSEVEIGTATGLTYDEVGNLFYLYDRTNDSIIAISEDGSRRVLSGGGEGSGPEFGFDIESIYFSKSLNSILVSDIKSDVILRVSIDSGDREILSGNASPNATNSFDEPWGIASVDSLGFALVVDVRAKMLLAVDLKSGNRVVISKGDTN